MSIDERDNVRNDSVVSTVNDVRTVENVDSGWFHVVTGWVFLVLGIVGIVMSAIITTEKVALLEDSQHVLSCSFNEAFSCGNVMSSPEASAFGFPNMIIGLFGFGIIAAIGGALLAGGRFKPWYWFATVLGLLFAVIFSHWLFYSAVYIIGALCVYCMVVWAVSIGLFMNVIAYTFHNFAPRDKIFVPVSDFLVRWWWLIALAWYGVLMLLTYIQFAG